jgi:hypothetical protein
MKKDSFEGDKRKNRDNIVGQGQKSNGGNRDRGDRNKSGGKGQQID